VSNFDHRVGDWRTHQPGRWEAYGLPSRSLPRFAGVYVVQIDGLSVYVGSSVDIANRFCEHAFRPGYRKNVITPWGDFPDSTPLTLKVRRSRRVGDWAMWEIRLIKRLRPEFNRQHRGRRAA
jgi:hypothetical protein